MKLQDLKFRRGKLEPPGWQVREAFSPLWSHAQFRWWSFVICAEGLAAARLPKSEWLPLVLRAGIKAGVGHLPTIVHGGGWPMAQHKPDVEIRSAVLFPRESLTTAVVEDDWVFWRRVRLADADGTRLRLTFADPVQAKHCRDRLTVFFNGEAEVT